MAYLNPNDAYQQFRDRAFEGIRAHFPIKNRFQTLELEKLETDDSQLHPDDLRAQQEAKNSGNTYAVPVIGHLVLRNTQTGEVIDRKKMRLAEIPRMTQRYSYIVGGQEYQVDNQWQLKPGAYVRRRKSGELETRFNVRNGQSFDVVLDDKSKQFFAEYKKAKVPLYPLMKTMGVDDDTLERTWGKEIFHASKNARGVDGAMERMYKTMTKQQAPSKGHAAEYVYNAFIKSEMRPDATEFTLGKPVTSVNGEALTLATQKMLHVHQGKAQPDDRDSIIFKDLRSAGDFTYDKLVAAVPGVRTKASRRLGKATNIRDIISSDMFNQPIQQSFHQNSAARAATQINPLEMVSASMQTTLTGTGGIKSERAITNEAKFIDPSHLGYLDPINTPEGSKTGVSLRLPMGVRKVGNTPMMRLYNIKSGQMEDVPPAKFMHSNVVLPDQVEWKDGKPVPKGETVRMAGHGNDIIEKKFDEAHYAMKHPSQMFNMTSNLIPFMHSTQGNRAGMASRHMEQAISLLHREPPLVQVATGVSRPSFNTFEKVLGYQTSHASPVNGVIKSIKPGSIMVEGEDGKTHEIQIYNHYPLNDAKSVLHSEPVSGLREGSRVHTGQVVADTNFTKGGTLALGTNLRVAYVPFKGYNFEDGVVISESAAKKLSSVHMYKPSVPTQNIVFDKRKFLLHQQGMFKKDQVEHIGDDGLPKVGARVKPGDPLVLALKPFDAKDKMGLTSIRKSLSGMHVDKSLTWDGETEGEVVGIVRKKNAVEVHVKAIEPMQVGDKLAGRYGNKGIVTMVLPDSQMPRTKAGEHMEVLLNPSGIPGRLNPAQVLEVAASKIAKKTGKPYVVSNFDGRDWTTHIHSELSKHGLTPTDELIDPETGKSIGHVTTGHQHIIKLVHQVDKKVHVTPGMGLVGTQSHDTYDLNLQPHHGQRVGALGMYALLAHGAKANIREMQTWKSEGEDPQEQDSKKWKSQHVDVWKAIQTGDPLPPPKPTFAFKKFEEMLRGTGVNLEKKGHELILTPMTHKDILALAPVALKNPGDRLEAKVDKKTGDLKTAKGGLFDETATGGHGGRKWSRIDLPEPMPNPMFEGPIKALTGIKKGDFEELVAGRKAIDSQGKVVPMRPGLLTGGHAVEHLLQKINVKADLAKAKEQLGKVPVSQLDAQLKKVKYLQALDQMGMKPDEAYILKAVPVVPPAMRPASPLPDGTIKYADLNQLYMHFGLHAQKLGDPNWVKTMPHEQVARQREAVYDGIKAIMGVGVPYKDQDHKGLLHQIAGPNPKKGFFQNVLMNKRQDLTMRSTIVPEPSLGLDQVGLPTEHALNLFRPFVVKKLQDMGVAKTPLQAQAELAKKTQASIRALDKVMAERPVLLKRDPVLHKYGIQGFQPTRVEGNAIKIHPLVCGGFNADFDGDTMSVFVPISREAVAEAHKMKPTNNLFAESSGKVVYTPSHEAIIGNYKLSMVGADTGKKFANPGQVIDAAHKGQIGHTDVVHLNGKKTTAGRVLLATALPQPMQHDILHNLDFRMDSKGLNQVLTQVGKNHAPDYDRVVNKLKDMGNHAAFGLVPVPLPQNSVNNLTDPKKNIYITTGAHTLSLHDFMPERELRAKHLAMADKKVQAIRANPKLSPAEKDAQVVAAYMEADKRMKDEHFKTADETKNNLLLMSNSGVKPGWAQYKQLRIAPLLYQDASGKIIPHAVKKTFSEGVDLADYWTHMHGARRGVVMRTQETRDPGYMSKLIMNTMMDTLVVDHDCGTNRGIAMHVGEPDIHDRLLARDFKYGGVHIPAGTTLTPDIIGQVRAVNKDAKLIVRSPLKCEHAKGLCQKCAGLGASGDFHPVGTNIGVIATQTLGERATQLPMKEFHCMHEHTTVLVREDKRVYMTTLGRLYERFSNSNLEQYGLEVKDAEGWTKIHRVLRHAQHEGTSMVMLRTRSGNFVVSQDNHPHMLRENLMVCPRCGTYPKKNNKTGYACRKCGEKWAGFMDRWPEEMVEPQQVGNKTHSARLVNILEGSETTPPLRSGYLAGVYCAKGWLHVRQEKGEPYTVGLGIAQNKGTTIYDRIRKEFVAEHGVAPMEQETGIHLYSVDLADKYSVFGRYSRDKGLPDGWLGMPAKWLANFVAGVVDGDGTLVSNDDSRWLVVRVDTTSVLLAQQLHQILMMFGVPAKVFLTKKRKKSVHQGLAVTFVLTGYVQSLLESSEKIGKAGQYKPLPLATELHDVVDYVRPFFFSSPPFVYDLETESHTLVANGIWTHNTGGAAGAGSSLVNSFTRLEQLMTLPKKVPNAASLAMVSGTVQKIQHTPLGTDVWINGKRHHVGFDPQGNPLHQPLPGMAPTGWQPPKVGMRVEAGQHLSDPSRTIVNMHDYYNATKSIDKVQNQLTSDIYDLYKNEGIRRRHVETIVKAMSGHTQVIDTGDSNHGILRGEFHPLGQIQKINAELVRAGKRPIEHKPALKGVNMLPLVVQEDWMAKLQHERIPASIQHAVATGQRANIHGVHPVPAAAYGAEFGMTEEKALLPGLGHLKNVKKHHY